MKTDVILYTSANVYVNLAEDLHREGFMGNRRSQRFAEGCS